MASKRNQLSATGDVYEVTASSSSCNDKRLVLPPAAVASVETALSVARRWR